jgi:hypothetical protein
MLLLHFYHMVNSLLGLFCSFCLQQVYSRMITLMINIDVNTTQFNIDIFIIDIFSFISESEDKEYVNLQF